MRITLISLSAVLAVGMAMNGCNSDSNDSDNLTEYISNPLPVNTIE
ncbi:MAG: hypothetical protein ABF276_06490 [Sulfurovum sp.]